MGYTRSTTIDASPTGDTAKQAVLDLDTDLTGAFNALNELIQKSIGTAKGDLIGFSSSGAPVRVPVGSSGQVLVADPAATSGHSYTDMFVDMYLINQVWS